MCLSGSSVRFVWIFTSLTSSDKVLFHLSTALLPNCNFFNGLYVPCTSWDSLKISTFHFRLYSSVILLADVVWSLLRPVNLYSSLTLSSGNCLNLLRLQLKGSEDL